MARRLWVQEWRGRRRRDALLRARRLSETTDRRLNAGSDPCTNRPYRTTSAEPIARTPMPNGSHGPDLFEIIRTTRSMRRLNPDPVPNELIRKILEAGVCAPSGGNMQRWRFLVIRNPKVKETVGALYKRAWDEQVGPRYRGGEPAPGMSRERFLRLLDAAEYMAAHIHEARCGSSLASKAAHRPARLGRRSILRCRTCCWRRERSASARL
jgi:Nitroreductase family